MTTLVENPAVPPVDAQTHRAIADALTKVWGFSSLRPNQMDAIAVTLAGRDSLVVMPTGGGKSLCYQLPPLVCQRPTLVVSPLIALMKDQVDSLRLVGYPAAALNSTVDADESRRIWDSVDAGKLKLLFSSPERLLTPGFLTRLVKAGIRTVAIDEAHCISQWGHDFRPEYRRLRELHDILPGVQINAYTATATPAVREDIVRQLGLRDPAVLVGIFDRPNLTYRVLPRVDIVRQTAEAVKRHPDQASIVYCISRKDTETLAGALKSLGVDAAAYHAGLGPAERRSIQEDFANERLGVVVATVAFGMGIDRSDVRCVVHAAMPKSIEHYQQETGRAGRDGLASECLMLYSAADASKWQMLFDKSFESGEVAGAGEDWPQQQRDHLGRMQGYCTAPTCRHRLLSEYFGQTYTPPAPRGCGACDVCLGEVETVDGSTVIAQKILSAVARASMTRRADGTPATFGVAHIVSILKGSNVKGVREWGHDQHTTFGLLADMPKEEISSYLNQLIDLGYLARAGTQFPTVHCTERARAVLKGGEQVSLGRSKAILAEAETLAARDRSSNKRNLVFDPGLFEALRTLRRALAAEKAVPPYIIFSDAVLQEIAAIRPTRRATFETVRGVGERKLAEFGKPFADKVREYCAANNLPTDVGVGTGTPQTPSKSVTVMPLSPNKQRALPMFERGEPLAVVAAALNLATSTVSNYLVEFVQQGRIRDLSPWIEPKAREEIVATATRLAADRLNPIFDHFGGKYAWDDIRLALAAAELDATPILSAAPRGS
jgi:ATP-dependent DNA helicase RecQ